MSKNYKLDEKTKASCDDIDVNMIILERNHQKPGYFRVKKDFITQIMQESDDDKAQEMFVVVRNTKSTPNN